MDEGQKKVTERMGQAAAYVVLGGLVIILVLVLVRLIIWLVP